MPTALPPARTVIRVPILLERAAIFVLIAGRAFACTGGQNPPDASGGENARPNVLLVFVDDLGGMDLGVYGSEIYEPPLDRLADSLARELEAWREETGADLPEPNPDYEP